jgi:ribosomal protein S17
MKREAIDFYAENKTPMEKLISIGVNRKGLSTASITAAAEQLYDEIRGGLKVMPVRVAWEVFSRARILKGHVEKKELDKTIDLQNVHDDLRERYGALHKKHDDLRERLDAAEKELQIKNGDIERYLKELEWYHQPWWKTIFRRPLNG